MKREIPEAFHPGEYLKEELEARGWSVFDLAKMTGLPEYTIYGILRKQVSITPEIAKALSFRALGTGAEVWVNLQTVYDLTKEIRLARRKNR